jgi:hypothetical protein
VDPKNIILHNRENGGDTYSIRNEDQKPEALFNDITEDSIVHFSIISDEAADLDISEARIYYSDTQGVRHGDDKKCAQVPYDSTMTIDHAIQ